MDRESYIDHNIIIDNIPVSLQHMMNELEEYDRTNQWWLYFDRADDLVVNAKNAYANNIISSNTYDKISEKYLYHALRVSEKEDS